MIQHTLLRVPHAIVLPVAYAAPGERLRHGVRGVPETRVVGLRNTRLAVMLNPACIQFHEETALSRHNLF